MFSAALTIKRYSFALSLCLAASLSTAQGQQGPRPATQDEEVVRINTELVQTDVMVFDKEGHFVEGLKPDQFELRIDGKLVPVSFFERVTAGSMNEDAQLAAARGQTRATADTKDRPAPKPLDRGRTILFFIDDLHLDPGNLPRTRAMLLRFIDREIGQNDQVAITSPSGQIGFLQQLTDNKSVMRAAIERLKPRQRGKIRDLERPPMSEYQALGVSRYDRDVTDYFVEKLLEENPMMSVDSATEQVRGRAQAILQQASVSTTNTLSSLASLIHTANRWPGRKVLFFISDGFFIDDQTSSNTFDLRRITDAAARAGVVIYSIDSRGLVASLTDASSQVAVDTTGRLARFDAGELSASQGALNALALDTGGRAQFNTNEQEHIIPKALEETSVYYLLAWRPEGQEQRGGKFRRIEVKVKGRPDLTVRVRRGFFDVDAKETAKRNSNEAQRALAANVVGDELRSAIRSLYTQNELPTHLVLAYMDMPNAGATLTALMQIDSEFIGFNKSENSEKGAVDLLGVVLNDQGKPVGSFSQHLNITINAPLVSPSERPNVLYNYQAKLTPGLYQARVAARDEKTGRVGSATEWIEIPDIASHKLSLSSLIVSEVTKEASGQATGPAAVAKARLSVDRHFNRASRLRFFAFIYNASRGASGSDAPDVAIQVQVLRDDQPVLTTPLRKIEYDNATDLARLPYAAEIPLETMLPGRYVLQVSVIDRIAKSSVSQHINFEID